MNIWCGVMRTPYPPVSPFPFRRLAFRFKGGCTAPLLSQLSRLSAHMLANKQRVADSSWVAPREEFRGIPGWIRDPVTQRHPHQVCRPLGVEREGR